MQDTLKLAAFNARKEEIEAELSASWRKLNELRYNTLEEFGHSEKMQSMVTNLCIAIDELQNNPLEESDFPDHFLEEPADDRSEKLDEDEQYL